MYPKNESPRDSAARRVAGTDTAPSGRVTTLVGRNPTAPQAEDGFLAHCHDVYGRLLGVVKGWGAGGARAV